MKVLPFKVPKATDESFKIQVENENHFYSLLHSHPEIQITYIIEGKGTLLAGDYLGNFKPGDLYIIGSGQPHVFKSEARYFNEQSDLKSRCISIFIHTNVFGGTFMLLPEVQQLKDFISGTERGLIYGTETAEKIYALMKTIIKNKGFEKLTTLLRILNLISSSSEFSYLSGTIKQKTLKDKEGERINKIYQFLMTESHRTISLKEVAELSSMTPHSFCRFFKLHTRKSFTRFLNEIRIGNASLLLQNSHKNISDICYETGFGNLSNFNRQFKGITGFSPKEFRDKSTNTLH